MPKINVYLPDDLAEAVRSSGVPVSTICQRALEAAVREANRHDHADVRALHPTGAGRRVRCCEPGRCRRRRPRERARAAALLTGDGVAAKAFAQLGVTDELVVAAMERRSSTADGSATYFKALQEALKLGHNYIGTEHLALGIDKGTPAADVLGDLGVTLSGLRSQVMTVLTGLGIAAPAHTAPAPELGKKLDEVIQRLEQLERSGADVAISLGCD